MARASKALSSGKGYFELLATDIVSSNTWLGGVARPQANIASYVGDTGSLSWGFRSNAYTYFNGTATSYGSTLADGNILQVAVDLDAGKIWFGKDNTWFNSGDPVAGTNETFSGVIGPLLPAFSPYGLDSATLHASSGDVAYSPPVGFSVWDSLATEYTTTAVRVMLPSSFLRTNVQDGGPCRITGTVTEMGTVGSYRVRLFDRISARCIRETWSAADGSYSFPYLAYRPNGYFAIAYDHGENPLNAAIADLITPEPML